MTRSKPFSSAGAIPRRCGVSAFRMEIPSRAAFFSMSAILCGCRSHERMLPVFSICMGGGKALPPGPHSSRARASRAPRRRRAPRALPRVLHVDRAGLEQRQRLEIARPGDEEAAGHHGCGSYGICASSSAGGYLLRRGDQGVTLQGGLRDVVVSGKEGLERFFVHGRAQAVDERLGVGIFCREVLRRGERVLLPRERAQRAVDQPGGALVGIDLCLLDGLIDGGGNGDLVQKQDLYAPRRKISSTTGCSFASGEETTCARSKSSSSRFCTTGRTRAARPAPRRGG